MSLNKIASQTNTGSQNWMNLNCKTLTVDGVTTTPPVIDYVETEYRANYMDTHTTFTSDGQLYLHIKGAIYKAINTPSGYYEELVPKPASLSEYRISALKSYYCSGTISQRDDQADPPPAIYVATQADPLVVGQNEYVKVRYRVPAINGTVTMNYDVIVPIDPI